MLYVIPAAGMKVPDPAAQKMPDHHLPPEGRLVEESGYWHRRVLDGDVTIAENVSGEGVANGVELDSPAIDPDTMTGTGQVTPL